MKKYYPEHPFNHKGQGIFILLFFGVWIADSFILKMTLWLSPYIPLQVRLILSGLIFIGAILLMRQTMNAYQGQLHHNHGLEDTGINKMIRTGPFKYIRNPLYLSIMLFCFGIFQTTLSLAALIALLILFTFYNAMASYEEHFLESKFGKEYLEYKKSTRKWL